MLMKKVPTCLLCSFCYVASEAFKKVSPLLSFTFLLFHIACPVSSFCSAVLFRVSLGLSPFFYLTFL